MPASGAPLQRGAVATCPRLEWSVLGAIGRLGSEAAAPNSQR